MHILCCIGFCTFISIRQTHMITVVSCFINPKNYINEKGRSTYRLVVQQDSSLPRTDVLNLKSMIKYYKFIFNQCCIMHHIILKILKLKLLTRLKNTKIPNRSTFLPKTILKLKIQAFLVFTAPKADKTHKKKKLCYISKKKPKPF